MNTDNISISKEVLERLYGEFVDFIGQISGEIFTSFRTSEYVDDEENYKYSIFNEAKRQLRIKEWDLGDIGSGKIQKAVDSAILRKVIHNHKSKQNNLIFWMAKDNFYNLRTDKELEQLFFDFYKNKISNHSALERLSRRFNYQTIAYLFFIKDRQQFLPISQRIFDYVFLKKLGIADFKTSDNLSWENYVTFISIIKEVHRFLKTKDPDVELLDAHSFLWILGKQRRDWLAKSGGAEESAGSEDSFTEASVREKIPEIIDSVFFENDSEEIRREEDKIKTADIPETEKEQLISARRGQGRFRLNTAMIESECRLTGVKDLRFLIASHIKPWKDSTNEERLDGNNGLLLSPHVDKLFDGGFISFSDDGRIICAGEEVVKLMEYWGLDASKRIGDFNEKQKEYLVYHRQLFDLEQN